MKPAAAGGGDSGSRAAACARHSATAWEPWIRDPAAFSFRSILAWMWTMSNLFSKAAEATKAATQAPSSATTVFNTAWNWSGFASAGR